jgi:hypothetical protein
MGGTACSRYQAYWYSHRSNEFNAAQRLRSIPIPVKNNML